MSTHVESQVAPHITGETVYEAKFDPRLITYSAWLISLFLAVSVVGVLLIPFWLAVSGWYGREFLRRVSARARYDPGGGDSQGGVLSQGGDDSA